MTCLVYEGSGPCLWCRGERDEHPYRWCRRCNGDLSTPDPTDREAQLAQAPSWAWRQNLCPCRHGIVTITGQPLTPQDIARLARPDREPSLPFAT